MYNKMPSSMCCILETHHRTGTSRDLN